MKQETKDQIIEILMTIYQIPGEFFIAGIISIEVGKSMLDFNGFSWILIVFGILCLFLEFISPFIAGFKLYEKAMKNLTKFIKIITK